MTVKYAVGVDVGGSSAKSGIYALGGQLVGRGSRAYQPAQPAPGVAEYDPTELRDAVEGSIHDALRMADVPAAAVVGVCCDAMISGTLGLDQRGQPTTPYTTTLDTRFNDELERMRQHEKQVRTLTGSGSPVVAAKIAWHRLVDAESYARTRVFVTAGGFVGGHLAGTSGEESFIDPTVLWAVGLSDTAASTWSTELTSALDVPMDLLPRIVPSTTVVGGISRAVSRRTGLRAGTPVVAGCGDQMAGFLGAGVLRSHVIGDSAGTYEVVGRRVTEFAPDDEGFFDIVPSAVGSEYVQQAVVAIGGGFTREWFARRIASGWSLGGVGPELDALAEEAPPGAEGLIFVPHLGGQGTPSRPWMRGGWLGLSWDHDGRHLARSMLESIAFEIAGAVEAFGGAERDTRICGYGGGARSAVAGQIKADVTGLRFASLGDIAPASLAAAMIAAIATGELEGLDDVVVSHAPITREFVPDAHRHEIYRALRHDYRTAVELAASFRTTP